MHIDTFTYIFMVVMDDVFGVAFYILLFNIDS